MKNIRLINNFYKLNENNIELINNSLSDFKIHYTIIPAFLECDNASNSFRAWLEIIGLLDKNILNDDLFKNINCYNIINILKTEFNLNLKSNDTSIDFLINSSFVDEENNLFLYHWYHEDQFKKTNDHFKGNFKTVNNPKKPEIRIDAPPGANNFIYFKDGIKKPENITIPEPILDSLKLLCFLNNKQEFNLLLKSFSTKELFSGIFDKLNHQNFFAFKIVLTSEDINKIQTVILPDLKARIEKYKKVSPPMKSSDISFFKLVYAKSISKML